MGKHKEFTGTTLSTKMHKTIIVKITQSKKHPKYGRILKKYTKFKVHDEKGSAKAGDIVRIEETRPLSKEKRFRLVEIIKQAEVLGIELKDEVK
jgi:small subunit ribosomal protein S17